MSLQPHLSFDCAKCKKKYGSGLIHSHQMNEHTHIHRETSLHERERENKAKDKSKFAGNTLMLRIIMPTSNKK